MVDRIYNIDVALLYIAMDDFVLLLSFLLCLSPSLYRYHVLYLFDAVTSVVFRWLALEDSHSG